MEVRVFKDAAAAFDKFVGTLGKLGGLFKASILGTLELRDVLAARKASSALLSLRRRQTRHIVRQSIGLMPILREYIRIPRPETWAEITDEIRWLLPQPQLMEKDIENAGPSLAFTDLYPKLISAIVERRIMLTKLLKSPEPSSTEALAEMTAFVDRYGMLIKDLEQVGLYEWAKEHKKKLLPLW